MNACQGAVAEQGGEEYIMMLLPLSLTTSPSFYESFEDVKAYLTPHPLLELSLTELGSLLLWALDHPLCWKLEFGE